MCDNTDADADTDAAEFVSSDGTKSGLSANPSTHDVIGRGACEPPEGGGG